LILLVSFTQQTRFSGWIAALPHGLAWSLHRPCCYIIPVSWHAPCMCVCVMSKRLLTLSRWHNSCIALPGNVATIPQHVVRTQLDITLWFPRHTLLFFRDGGAAPCRRATKADGRSPPQQGVFRHIAIRVVQDGLGGSQERATTDGGPSRPYGTAWCLRR
jgi:hypothetical protein